jgi:hypothetical protein
MDAVIKELVKQIEKNRLQSGIYSATGYDNLANKFEHIATGLEMAHKILISEMVAN